jgi:hypothetical protein
MDDKYNAVMIFENHLLAWKWEYQALLHPVKYYLTNPRCTMKGRMC